MLRGVGLHAFAAAVRRAVALRAVNHGALKKRRIGKIMRIQCSDTNYLSAYEEAFDLVLELLLLNFR